MGILKRIRNWHRGYYQPAFPGAVDDPPVCECGHYFAVPEFPERLHDDNGCKGWARDQWATLGRISVSLRCRCRKTRYDD